MRRLITVFMAVLALNVAMAQNFILPLDLRPTYLAANFGELRPNHFHSGLDMKTDKVEGKVVRSVDTGYVSRVQISPTGYGHVLYVNHPSGYTTVYAHLKSFEPRIDSVVRAYQYEHKKHQIDISFTPEQLPVSRGQQIALSGNTGSSGGPHLHFEIRKTENQHALNPMLFYNLKDNVAPKIYRIGVYPMDNESFVNGKSEKQLFEVVSKGNGVYALNVPVKVWGKIGFSVQGFDYMPEMSNIYGFYTTTLSCNNKTIYSRKIDEIDFATTADINSLIDYEERLVSKRNYERMFVKPNNELEIYTKLENQGIYEVTDAQTAQCEVRVTDFAGNAASLQINLIQTNEGLENQAVKSSTARLFSCADTFSYTYEKFQFKAKAKTFFEDFTFDVVVSNANAKKRYYSSVYKLVTDQVMFKKSAEIIIPYSLPDSLQGKAIIENCGKRIPVMTKFDDNGCAHAFIKTPGSYAVVVDTVAPSIKISQEKLADMTNQQYILFKMSDNYSGVAKYNAYIDGEWQILDYDAKSSAVFLWFDKDKMEFGKKHTLRIVLEDLCHNVFDEEYEFYK
ncbi:MAG: M23 family metallopeptidase [Bacteroidales bacterium]|nr:M23 family metallopeptidase [Bacteroidales bacterium]